MKRNVFLLSLALAAGWCQESCADKRTDPVDLPFETTCVVTGRDITCSFALKELNEIVTKACGQAFVTGRGQRSRSTKECSSHRIFLGRTAEAEKVLGSDFFEGGKDYKSETSCVFGKGGDVYIVGSDAAGTLWAVYDFVEDNLGYRWYQECRDDLRAENEIVPKSETVAFRGLNTRRRPGFDGYRRDHENWGYFRLFRLRHRSNSEISSFVKGYRFGLDGRTAGHGFDMYLPRKPDAPWMGLKMFPPEVKVLAPAFEKHSEWFSVDRNGRRSDRMQLCLSSAATRDALWQSLQWWVKRNGTGVYMIGSNDEHTGVYCYCDGCRALDKRYGGQCGALWDCVIDLCGRLKAAKMDGVYIASLAYRHQTQLCPPGVTFPDNFICDFAPVTWDRSLSEVRDETLEDGRTYNWLRNCRDWCKACPGGVSYWYYGNSICAYTWGRMRKELDEIYEAGVRSAGLCGLEGGYEFEDLMHHMWFWCLYHPTGDAHAEFKRTLDAKYGPAADDILAYADVLEKMRRKVVAATPCGPSALDILTFATSDDLKAMVKLHDRAAAKAAGTKFAENVSWARISLDVALFFKDGDPAAESRARAASMGYVEKVSTRKLMRKGNVVTDRLDVMANYANLKSDALPPELAKYSKTKVHRVLPAKSQPYSPWGYAVKDKLWSEPDPQAVCGFAMADTLDDGYIPGGKDELRLGLYDHNKGKYLIPFGSTKFPKDFWEKDKYKLFCLGRSGYASRTILVWTDVHGYTGMPYSPLKTQLLSRLYDTVVLDKQFETWISVKAQGPKFFPDDTRPNKIFIEQIFSVEL